MNFVLNSLYHHRQINSVSSFTMMLIRSLCYYCGHAYRLSIVSLFHFLKDFITILTKKCVYADGLHLMYMSAQLIMQIIDCCFSGDHQCT